MNKNFEVAKVLATIAGFLVVASSIFFTSSRDYYNLFLNYIPTTETPKDIIPTYRLISKGFLEMSNNDLLIGGLVLMFVVAFGGISIMFLRLGYIEAQRRESAPLY